MNDAPLALLVLGLEAQYIGGIERQMHELTANLGDAGWRVALCYASPPADVVKQYLDRPNVVWDQLPREYHRRVQMLRSLMQLLRRHRPTVVHLYFTPFLSLYPLLARCLGVKRVIFHDQGSHTEGYVPRREPLVRRILGRMLTWPITTVVSASDFNSQVLRIRGQVQPHKLRRIYNDTWPIDPPEAELGPAFRRRRGIPLEKTVVLQTSHLIREKGVSDALAAAAIACARNPRLHFIFAGEGPCRTDFKAEAEALGIAPFVTWLGAVPDPMVEGLYAAADICCQPSRWEEAFGFVIAEAMVSGKPVVATAVGGIPEVVLDGITGYLVPRQDPAQLAERILRLANDPDLAKAMGQTGRRVSLEKFNVLRNSKELVNVCYAGLPGRPFTLDSDEAAVGSGRHSVGPAVLVLGADGPAVHPGEVRQSQSHSSGASER